MGKVIVQTYFWLCKQAGISTVTEEVREDQKDYPLLYLLIFLVAGILVVKIAKKHWWQILVGFLLGILIGHLWW